MSVSLVSLRIARILSREPACRIRSSCTWGATASQVRGLLPGPARWLTETGHRKNEHRRKTTPPWGPPGAPSVRCPTLDLTALLVRAPHQAL